MQIDPEARCRMYSVKSNEREFMSQVVSWLNELLGGGTYPFELASSEPSIKVSLNVSEKKTRFPDVQIWLNRQAGQGFCGWELKTPATAADDPKLLEDAAEKARAMNADYFVTWNMRAAIIWRTPQPGNLVTAYDKSRSYQPISQISKPDDLWVKPNPTLLRNRAKEILDDLAVLKRDGHFHLIETDTTFFVIRLNEAVKKLYPHIKEGLTKRVGADSKFKNNLFNWAAKQGITRYDDPSFYDVVAHQIAYRLLTRILFYLTLGRDWSSLPKLDISGLSAESATKKLRETFQQARLIDWHAVFEEDVPDDLALPDLAIDVLDKLIIDLNRFNFSQMPQDVIGAVFEKLIPYEERHSLGQYFTPENLVDLINAFCVRTVNDVVLDPTCGTGTFLTRAYDKMKVAGQRDHKKLLSQLWGTDIASFPAQLATINLFRQDLSDRVNFPRVIRSDFFKVSVGQSFEFPPPRVSDVSFTKVKMELPVFDAAVGNFPYIRQELIEKVDKGNKQLLERTLKQEWLADYPDVFVITEDELKEYRRGQKIDFSKVGFRLSGQADIYAYLFFHTARFVREGGRMGFVTSNSWLDVGYGYELQKFLLNNFKLIAIVESRCEPWFEDAAINTIVTIVERCSSKQERDNQIAKFVKVKKRLAELIPWDMKLEAPKRWHGLDVMVYKIESTGKEYYKLEKETYINTLTGLKSYEDDNFRIRLVKQGELLDNIIKEGKTAKWGQYLRAPDVYFDILLEAKEKLANLCDISVVNRGVTTNNVDFFYLTPDKIAHRNIEGEFILSPVVYTPKEVPNIELDESRLIHSLFVCNKSRKEIFGTNALKYIKDAESQRINKSLSFKGRNDWYSLGNVENRPCSLFYARQDDKFRVTFNPKGFVVNDNLYTIVPKEDVDNELLCALLNSSLFALGLEVIGRVNLGEGALKIQAYELGDNRLPNPSKITKNEKTKIIQDFRNLAQRATKNIFEEVKMKDRHKLDSLILQALGLDPDKYLKTIYDGLTELVRERIELASMRKKVKQAKTQRDIDKLMKQVMEDLLPDGVKKFPDEFLEAAKPFLIKDKAISDAVATDEGYVKKVLPLVQERAKVLSELPKLTHFFFESELDYDASLLIGKKMDKEPTVKALTISKEKIEQIASFDAESLETLFRPLAEELGLKTGQLFGTLRIAVTGREVAPPLFATMAVLGRDKCLKRIDVAMEKLSQSEGQ